VNKLLKYPVIFCLIVALIFVGTAILKIEYPIRHSAYVAKYADENGLNKYFVYAIIKAESNFDNEAESSKNAMGLMQIMEPTGKWISEKLNIQNYNKEMLSEPETNIKMGCYYISYLLDRYDGNEKCALAAYNAGHANVDLWLSDKSYSRDGKTLTVIPYPETETYVNLVLKNQKIYQHLY